jgi:CBS-domain-containing membrane protein
MMGNDSKLGLACGVAIVIAAAVMVYPQKMLPPNGAEANVPNRLNTPATVSLTSQGAQAVVTPLASRTQPRD